MTDLVAENVVKEFESPNEPLRILDGVSLELNRGENVAVVGPSGSGKSTFLHLVGTLDNLTSGKISLLGTDLSEIGPSKVAEFRNQHIGFVFQEHHLLPQLTALENVLIPWVARGRTSPSMMDRAKRLLDRVGLGSRLEHRPAQLSGGERQRVAVARALVCSPVLVLADEPTGSLDSVSAEAIGNILLELQAADDTMLICVTHSEPLAGKFQKQVRLENGKFVRDEIQGQ